MTTPRRPRVFFDVAVGDEPLGRVIFQLYADLVPKTAENFRVLCTGERGVSSISGQALYYKNATFHRIIPDFMIQGGDITKHNGTGGESIYANATSTTFADEPSGLSIPLSTPGLLAMANRGPHTNSSQFFITLAPCEHLNGKHVVFGKVVRGFDEVVKALEKVRTGPNDKPLDRVFVTACGELEFKGLAAGSGVPQQQARERPEKRGRSRSRSKSSRSRSRSAESRSSSANSEDEAERRERKRRRKEEKREAKRKRKEEKKAAKQTFAGGDPIGDSKIETEEEYDLRLEREETERKGAARKEREAREKEEARMGKVDERTGIRFKGRGVMKYRDPEMYRRNRD